MYMANRIGARIEPCGTPQEMLAGEEKQCPMLTEKVLFERYDLNQARAESVIPALCWSRSRRMLWSVVSNAALMSKG